MALEIVIMYAVQYGLPLGTAIVAYTLFSRSALGRAVFERLQRGSADSAAVHELAQALDELRHDLVEVHERLDFVEHLLSRAGEAPQLTPPESASTPA